MFNFNDYYIKVLNLDTGGFEYSKVLYSQISQEINIRVLKVKKKTWDNLKIHSSQYKQVKEELKVHSFADFRNA